MAISRLSAYNIADPLIRAELYRDVMDGAADNASGWTEYEIQPDERLMPELISDRVYGTDECKWVVLIVAGVENYRDPMPVGSAIFLPPIAWVRQRIRHYSTVDYT